MAVPGGKVNVRSAGSRSVIAFDAAGAKGGLPTQPTDANFECADESGFVQRRRHQVVRSAAVVDGTRMRFDKAPPEAPRP